MACVIALAKRWPAPRERSAKRRYATHIQKASPAPAAINRKAKTCFMRKV